MIIKVDAEKCLQRTEVDIYSIGVNTCSVVKYLKGKSYNLTTLCYDYSTWASNYKVSHILDISLDLLFNNIYSKKKKKKNSSKIVSFRNKRQQFVPS